ncbi:MAG: hypothetical protein CR977_03940 [Gammaproteobacteria bacterium]|nr:MAG: hypothetical protein CR977_03940 [Gammaproteobacteria bacterium]
MILITLFFNRIIFHNPMPIKLMPTLFILLAPPAVGFLAYVKLTGEVDVFARILYYSAAFLFLLLTVQVRVFIKVPFFLSWWAYSFPLAATTLATFVMSRHLPDNSVLWYFAVLLYTVLLGVIALLLTLTLKAALKQQICVNED